MFTGFSFKNSLPSRVMLTTGRSSAESFTCLTSSWTATALAAATPDLDLPFLAPFFLGGILEGHGVAVSVGEEPDRVP